MSFKRLLQLLLPPKEDRLEELSAMRTEVDQHLDEIVATLDGEDQWFIRSYDEQHKEAPACGIRPGQKHRTQE